MQTLRVFLLSLALTVTAPAAGLVPYLVKDINTSPEPVGALPTQLISLGNLVLFQARNPSEALWRSDGTVAGTYPLQEVRFARPLALIPGRLFFLDEASADSDTQVWVSDGNLPGTFQLTTGPLRLPYGPGRAAWVPAQRALFFTAENKSYGHGLELWRTDGTPGGTYEVADIWPGSRGSNPRELTKFKGKIYFVADDPEHGPALWRSDGTAQGTELVQDTALGPEAFEPQALHVLGPRLVFIGANPSHGSELWVSDGTTDGTRILKDLVKGKDSPHYWEFVVNRQRLYFVTGASKREELWTTDGTTGGTLRLANFAAPSSELRLLQGLPAGPLIFRVDVGVRWELWATDGTVEGTRLLRDICPDVCGGSPAILGLVQGNLYFSAWDYAHGNELWATDGTEAGTRLVRDICKGECNSWPSDPVPMRDRLLFLADDGIHPDQIWATDGTAEGTVAFADVSNGPVESLEGATAGAMLIFSFSDKAHGEELWCTDGTRAGTVFLSDLMDENLGGSYPGELMASDGTAFFFANDGEHGFELWKSDGTATGTSLVSEMKPGKAPSRRPELGSWTATPTWLIFHIAQYDRSSARRASASFPYPPPTPHPWDNTLWAVHGTRGIVWRLTPDKVSSSGSLSPPMGPQGSLVYFSAKDLKHGQELWVTDGTPAGTRLFADLVRGEESSAPFGFVVFQGKLWFFADRRLWRSDGTVAGTVTVGPRFSDPLLRPTVYRGRLWFLTSRQRTWLWSTDGTDTGTIRNVEPVPGSSPDMAGPELFTDGERLYISIRTFEHKSKTGLWVSDGTAAGTRKISDQAVCPNYPTPTRSSKWAAFGGRLFYSSDSYPDCNLAVSDGTAAGTRVLRTADGGVLDRLDKLLPFGNLLIIHSGHEIWQTDGTEAGTSQILELAPWRGEVDWPWIRAGSRVFFPSWDAETGSELWAIRE